MEINEAYKAIIQSGSVRTKSHLLRKYGINQFVIDTPNSIVDENEYSILHTCMLTGLDPICLVVIRTDQNEKQFFRIPPHFTYDVDTALGWLLEIVDYYVPEIQKVCISITPYSTKNRIIIRQIYNPF
jgi:hypothetical protein